MEQTEKDLESLSGASSLCACPDCRLHDARPLAMTWSGFTIPPCCTTICIITISASAAKHALYDGQLLTCVRWKPCGQRTLCAVLPHCFIVAL